MLLSSLNTFQIWSRECIAVDPLPDGKLHERIVRLCVPNRPVPPETLFADPPLNHVYY